jgi:zinc transport system permease protein
VRRRSELAYDTVIGVFFAVTVAVGIVIISLYPRVMRATDAIIYGDILTISEAEIAGFFALFLVTFGFLAYCYNTLMLKGISDRLASTHGIRTKYYDYAFAGLLAVVITTSIRAVGLLLVTAMLVVPAGAARNLARTTRQQFWLSIAVGTFSGVSGLILSSYLNTATGATIILTSGVIFLLTQYVPRVFGKLVRA